MNPDVLEYINNTLDGLGINYSYMRKSGKVTYPYFVGEYIESPENNESGETRTNFLLSGWTNGSWLDFEKVKQTLADSLRDHTALVNGYGVAIYYSSSHPIPSEDTDMKRIQITLEIRVWRNR